MIELDTEPIGHKMRMRSSGVEGISTAAAIIIAIIVAGAIAVGVYVVLKSTPSPTHFSMQVIPEHIEVAVPGQRCVFLVVVADEGQESGEGKAVSISATASKASVTVNTQAVIPGQVAEVTAIPDEASVGGNATVTVHGEREGLKKTETVTIEVWEFRWPIEKIREDQGGALKTVRDRFIPWLAANHPELGITSETEWTGVVIKPLMPVQMFYLFLSEEWEMGVSKHVMIPPDDWALMYLRRRFTEAHPSYAFEISSLEGQEDPHAIDPPESVWR